MGGRGADEDDECFSGPYGAGVSFSGGKGWAQGQLVTLAIGVHNIPEGMAVATVLAARGVPAWKCAAGAGAAPPSATPHTPLILHQYTTAAAAAAAAAAQGLTGSILLSWRYKPFVVPAVCL